MASSSIIKDLNVIEYFCFSFFTGFEGISAYFLLLQTAEEGFHGRIVIAIPAPANAGYESVSFAGQIKGSEHLSFARMLHCKT